jgi:pilus assembly protein CpaC
VGQITIQFKEFGIRLNFLPTITPRGTIRLVVTPEVSSLDYANGLTVSGFTIPGLATRRVQTEVELETGQSFVIAGLLDNQVTENLNKIPGLSSIPLLGKLFQSRSLAKNNTELLVLVTPELVGPIPANVKPPGVKMDAPFLNGTAPTAPQNPGQEVTGTLSAPPRRDSLPIEQFKNLNQSTNSPAGPTNNPAAVQPVVSAQPATPAAPLPTAQPTTAGPSH